jgi:hypothetical protein
MKVVVNNIAKDKTKQVIDALFECMNDKNLSNKERQKYYKEYLEVSTKLFNTLQIINTKTIIDGLRLGLGSQGIWTPELEEIILEEIKKKYYEKIRIKIAPTYYKQWLFNSQFIYNNSNSNSNFNISDDMTAEKVIEKMIKKGYGKNFMNGDLVVAMVADILDILKNKL